MTETWKTIPDFPNYEASSSSVWRTEDGVLVQVSGGIRRASTGLVLKARKSNRGYLLINVYGDAGPVTKTVHSLILSAFDGPCPEGQEARHLNDDPLDNSWPVNLCWGTPAENEADKVTNGNRPGPRPPKECVRCGAPFAGNGKRCHECVVWIGVKAAELLTAGTSLADACFGLEYPSAEGLHTLAVKYGGYGAQPPPSWLRRVAVALRDWLRAGDAA